MIEEEQIQARFLGPTQCGAKFVVRPLQIRGVFQTITVRRAGRCSRAQSRPQFCPDKFGVDPAAPSAELIPQLIQDRSGVASL